MNGPPVMLIHFAEHYTEDLNIGVGGTCSVRDNGSLPSRIMDGYRRRRTHYEEQLGVFRYELGWL